MFFVVAQWQGSGSSRALRLVDGAAAVRGDLPSSSTIDVEVPAEAGDEQATGVNRYSSVLAVRDRLALALSTQTEPAIVVGGDCGVELGALSHLLADETTAEGLAVVWFDAHPDLNTPQSSPSGAFTGMVLRTLLGDGPAGLVPPRPLSPARLVLVGARDIDDGEDAAIREHGIRMLPTQGITADLLLEAVAATGARSVYIHIDLDVLDPGVIAGLHNPVPFGLSAVELGESVRALKQNFALAGAGITAFAPASPEEADDGLPTILRLIGALTAQ